MGLKIGSSEVVLRHCLAKGEKWQETFLYVVFRGHEIWNERAVELSDGSSY